MKKVILMLVSLAFSTAFYGQIPSQNVKSKINEITVFFTSAEVERTAQINLKKGMNKLVYSNITPKLQKESIHAITGKDISVVSVNTYNKEVDPDQKRIKQLKDSLKMIEQNLYRLETELSILNKTLQILDNNTQFNSEEPSTVEQIVALNSYYSKEVKRLYTAISTTKNQIEVQDQLKNLTEIRLNSIKISSKKKDEMIIELVLYAKQATPNSKVRLKYLVGGAGWTPLYVINVDQLNPKIKLKFQAKVINQTGINWDNIKMNFSTASLNRNQEAPTLDPWNLNFNNRNIQEGRLDQYRPKDISTEEASRNNQGLEVIKGVKYIETEEVVIKNIYKTSNQYYIPSDSKTYFIDINEHELPVSYAYYSVPKVNANAFLMAQITDWEKLDLMEGQTKIWFNNNYVGSSYIRPQYALDTLDVSLGSDDKVFVNKVKLKDKDSETLIGTHKKQTFKYKITVRNTNASKVKFTLRDQIPVSQHQDIKVETIEISNAEMNEDSGNLKWKFDLDAGESREFYVSFSVKFPKNKKIRIRENRRTSSSYKSIRFL